MVPTRAMSMKSLAQSTSVTSILGICLVRLLPTDSIKFKSLANNILIPIVLFSGGFVISQRSRGSRRVIRFGISSDARKANITKVSDRRGKPSLVFGRKPVIPCLSSEREVTAKKSVRNRFWCFTRTDPNPTGLCTSITLLASLLLRYIFSLARLSLPLCFVCLYKYSNQSIMLNWFDRAAHILSAKYSLRVKQVRSLLLPVSTMLSTVPLLWPILEDLRWVNISFTSSEVRTISHRHSFVFFFPLFFSGLQSPSQFSGFRDHQQEMQFESETQTDFEELLSYDLNSLLDYDGDEQIEIASMQKSMTSIFIGHI